jgi:hypothetical protein
MGKRDKLDSKALIGTTYDAKAVDKNFEDTVEARRRRVERYKRAIENLKKDK